MTVELWQIVLLGAIAYIVVDLVNKYRDREDPRDAELAKWLEDEYDAYVLSGLRTNTTPTSSSSSRKATDD